MEKRAASTPAGSGVHAIGSSSSQHSADHTCNASDAEAQSGALSGGVDAGKTRRNPIRVDGTDTEQVTVTFTTMRGTAFEVVLLPYCTIQGALLAASFRDERIIAPLGANRSRRCQFSLDGRHLTGGEAVGALATNGALHLGLVYTNLPGIPAGTEAVWIDTIHGCLWEAAFAVASVVEELAPVLPATHMLLRDMAVNRMAERPELVADLWDGRDPFGDVRTSWHEYLSGIRRSEPAGPPELAALASVLGLRLYVTVAVNEPDSPEGLAFYFGENTGLSIALRYDPTGSGGHGHFDGLVTSDASQPPDFAQAKPYTRDLRPLRGGRPRRLRAY